MRNWGNTIAGPLGVLAATLLLPVLGVLHGCATQFDLRAASRSGDAETASPGPVLKFQRSSIAPRSDEAFVLPEDLQPGDILLTSAPTIKSSAIQMMTQAPVSHAAVYIGDGKVVEAVPPDVRIRSLREVMAEEKMVLALRHPGLTAEQFQKIREYALGQTGTRFNVFGIAMHAPYGITRKVCELPLVPASWRDVCIRSVGSVFHVATSQEQFFCSQLVLQAYRQAGVPLTQADPRLISPADILHMREGDVPSVRIHQPLRQVGHLKYEQPIVVALE